MALLEVTLSRAGYGPVTVLHDIGAVVETGELVAVLGANGAGKTTLLRTISGMQVRSDARISFDSTDVSRLPAHRRARLGIAHVPEGRQVFAGLTVGENLRVAALAAGNQGSSLAEFYQRVDELFPALRNRFGEQATSLSGGEQQMLAIGRGLMAAPRLLMVDEASLGLSPALTHQLFAALAQIRHQGIAILLVEQNAKSALAVADRAYVLERGRIALAGTASELGTDDRLAGLYLGGHGEHFDREVN